MLNQETKRRIDSARDILVGKIPDPKAQVEQITTALIYKFMDDMDNESEELGGKARFFVKEYEKYSWSKLLDPRLGGYDRLNLYSEALLKMPQNPNLPQLFRNILKDAFLPYRDTETLNLFLKEINGFTYDHSEKLGDAYEYLLSVLGSQGDAGQFRTPRHIIDFIVEVVDPKKDETILDPACGTAGFLISAYKHILKQNTIHRLGDQLTPEEKTKLMQHFVGYDISPDMVRLSLTNMYLHSFPNPNVFEYDTLTSEERWDETYDVIMANPPFMSPTGGIRPHKRFSIQANRSEVLFVDYIAEHLTINGRAGIIVPEGIIFQSGNAYKALRKMLVEKYVWAVVSLPGGIFQPYSGVKTSILLMDKTLAKKAENILFVKVENDGFDLGAQRRAIEKNDLAQALVILQRYKQAMQMGEDPSAILDSSKVSNMAVIAKKAQIAKSGDYNLSGERYKEIHIRLHQEWPLVKISDLAERITKGTTPTTVGFRFEDKGIRFIKIESISEDGMIIPNKIAFISEECHETLKRSQLKQYDILFSIAGAFGRAAVVEESLLPANTNQALAIISPKLEVVNPQYLFHVLKSKHVLREVQNQIVGVAQYNLSLTQVSNLIIPLPPLEVQQEIVAELDSYQKIIDGAKQVVENYKPAIKIDPSWEAVELGNLANLTSGGTPSRDKSEFWDGDIPWIKTGQINYYVIKQAEEYISKAGLENSSAKIIPQGTILMALYGQGITRGKVGILGLDAAINQACLAIMTTSDKINRGYLFCYLMTQYEHLRKISEDRGGNQSNLNSQIVRQLQIPLPDLTVQTQIVSKLEEEQKLVEANKRLIEIFEEKIKDKIAEVWGELEVSEAEVKTPPQFGTFKQAQRVQQSDAEQAELGLA